MLCFVDENIFIPVFFFPFPPKQLVMQNRETSCGIKEMAPKVIMWRPFRISEVVPLTVGLGKGGGKKWAERKQDHPGNRGTLAEITVLQESVPGVKVNGLTYFFFNVDHFSSLYWIYYNIVSVLDFILASRHVDFQLPTQGLNPSLLHWKAKSQPPDLQGSPGLT